MQDFLLNIDNKEILIEILHHSIDYLIGNRDDEHTLRLCHKYGFQSPDDFMLTTKSISRCYRNCCTESESELMSEFANLSAEQQKLVPLVLAARRPEVMRFLMREHNSQQYALVESFDWDLRFILGDSSYAQNRRQIVTITFNCREAAAKKRTLHFQLNRPKLDEFIAALEAAVKDEAHSEEANKNAIAVVTKN